MRILLKQELIDYLNSVLPKHEAIVRSNDGNTFTKQEMWTCQDIINAIGKFEPINGDLLEFKVPPTGRLNDLIDALHVNGYSVQTSVIWKDLPENGIDCFIVRADGPRAI